MTFHEPRTGGSESEFALITEGDAWPEFETASPLEAARSNRCYGEEAVGEPSYRYRRLLGAVTHAWADDRKVIQQLTEDTALRNVSPSCGTFSR